MKVKKLFSVIAAMCMIFALTACSETPKEVNIVGFELPEEFELSVGESIELESMVKFITEYEGHSEEQINEKAKDITIKWETANEAVAKLDETGVLTGVSEGETDITIYSEDIDFATFADVIIVSEEAEEIEDISE